MVDVTEFIINTTASLFIALFFYLLDKKNSPPKNKGHTASTTRKSLNYDGFEKKINYILLFSIFISFATFIICCVLLRSSLEIDSTHAHLIVVLSSLSMGAVASTLGLYSASITKNILSERDIKFTICSALMIAAATLLLILNYIMVFLGDFSLLSAEFGTVIGVVIICSALTVHITKASSVAILSSVVGISFTSLCLVVFGNISMITPIAISWMIPIIIGRLSRITITRK